MIQFFRAWRARNAAVEVIESWLTKSRRRLGGIPESAWLDPYIVGFLTMLISLIATHSVGGLRSQTVGNVQAEAWRRLTGCSSELIGERICLLSVSEDKHFLLGCQRADQFFRSLGAALKATGGQGSPFLGAEGLVGSEPPSVSEQLWREYFDSCIRT